MDANTRRTKIVRILESGKTFNATQLAERFGVTRQIIVSDIARLRSAGNDILSGKNGYSVLKPQGVAITVTCRHNINQLQRELYAVVDNGGEISDEAIEHPVYGTVRISVNISSRHTADAFIQNLRESRAGLLSELTGGLHSHTVRANDNETLERIKAQLSEMGILARDEAPSSAVPAWLF